MNLRIAVFVLPLIFSANLLAGSFADDEELLSAAGKIFCENTKYLECLGLTNAGCVDAYIKTARVCSTRHPISQEMDKRLEKVELRKYGDCTANEIRKNLGKHDACSAHLETTFDKITNDARNQLDNSRSQVD